MSRYLYNSAMSFNPSTADLLFVNRSSCLSCSTSSGPPAKIEISRQSGQAQAGRTLQLDVFADAVCNIAIQALLLGHLLADVFPRHLRMRSLGRRPQARRSTLTLSSLSTADEIVRILSAGTPQTAKMPSRIFRWLSCWRSVSGSPGRKRQERAP